MNIGLNFTSPPLNDEAPPFRLDPKLSSILAACARLLFLAMFKKLTFSGGLFICPAIPIETNSAEKASKGAKAIGDKRGGAGDPHMLLQLGEKVTVLLVCLLLCQQLMSGASPATEVEGHREAENIRHRKCRCQ